MPARKVANQTFKIPDARGNGLVHREVWVDSKGQVTRYALAYINHEQYQGDNGRVLGYDNAHGYHHRHFMGTIEPVENFSGFEDIEQRFAVDMSALLSGRR